MCVTDNGRPALLIPLDFKAHCAQDLFELSTKSEFPMTRSSISSAICSLLVGAVVFSGFRSDAAETESTPTEWIPSPKTAANRKKLERIIIPKMEFHDATLREAIDFLKKKSIDCDTDFPPGERGLNIVLSLEVPIDGDVAPGVPIPGLSIPGSPSAIGPNPMDPRITLSLKEVTLLEALSQVTTQAHLRLKIGPDRIYILNDRPSGQLVTKEWKVPRNLMALTSKEQGTTNITDREMAKNWLIARGVTFSERASAIYIVKSSRLIVRNTQKQLNLVDQIVQSREDPGPIRVDIECTLVEIPQEAIAGSKFESLLLGDWRVPTRNAFISGGNVGFSRSPIRVSAGDFGEGDRSTGLSRVFTDPQLQQILRSLKENKSATIFSTPKVTVENGQRAVVEVTRELGASPDDPSRQALPTARVAAGDGVGETGKESVPARPAAAPSKPHPHHNLRVALEVTPVVGSDGYTLDLRFGVRAIEFDGLAPNGKEHPLFNTHKRPGAVPIYDGSSVFFDDILREDPPKLAGASNLLIGKVPLLGRISEDPLDRQATRDLMIFVSASLVNAPGGPGPEIGEKEQPIETVRPPETVPSALK